LTEEDISKYKAENSEVGDLYVTVEPDKIENV